MVTRKLNRRKYRRNKRNTRQRKGKKQTSKLIKCKTCNKSKRISRKKVNELRNAGGLKSDILKALCCGKLGSEDIVKKPSPESVPTQAIPILTEDGMGYTINSASMKRATDKALLFGNSNMVNKQLIGRLTIVREKDINGKSIPYKRRRAYITVYKGDNATTLVNDFMYKHPLMLFPNELGWLEGKLNAYLNRPASRGISALREEIMGPVLKGIKIENKKGNSEMSAVASDIPVAKPIPEGGTDLQEACVIGENPEINIGENSERNIGENPEINIKANPERTIFSRIKNRIKNIRK